MSSIRVKDKEFSPFLSSAEIQKAVKELGKKISEDFKGEKPLFLIILNGSFIFAADLVRAVELDCEISFVKLSSYSGTSTTGEVRSLIGLNESLEGRKVIIVEDIIDTGITLDSILRDLWEKKPASISLATLLFKPNAFQKDFEIDYVGIEIPNDFIVGYGLDYDGLARNYPEIYKLKQ